MILINIAESWGIEIEGHIRGEVIEFHYHDSEDNPTLEMSIESAWSDYPELWNGICNSYSSLQNYYISEECGDRYYATNDVEGKFFKERYVVGSDDGYDYFTNMSEVLEYVSEFLGKSVTEDSLLDEIEEFNNNEEDNYLTFHEIEIN